MFMYSNGPVSIRCARTSRLSGSAVRLETQLHTLPSSSGCMVRRNVTVLPSRSRMSAAAYSLKSCGHDATSLVMSQTSSTGALMTIALSVCPAMTFFPYWAFCSLWVARNCGAEAGGCSGRELHVDVIDHRMRREQLLGRIIGDHDAKLVLDLRGHFEDRERVVSKVFKSHVAYLAVQVHGFVDPSARAHNFSQVIEGK